MGSPSEGVLLENHSVYVYKDNLQLGACREKARLPQERLPPISLSLLIYIPETVSNFSLDLNLSS